MKNYLLLALGLALFISCDPYYTDYYEPPSDYKPVLIKREILEQSIRLLPPQELVNYGKIYTKDNLLFVNERNEGVHIFNNVNPANPVALGFISILGNIDISIKDDIIYADNATDLVALRFDGSTVTEVDRNRNVFPELGPPDGLLVEQKWAKESRPANTVIVKWVKK
jgi:hypothetical protein